MKKFPVILVVAALFAFGLCPSALADYTFPTTFLTVPNANLGTQPAPLNGNYASIVITGLGAGTHPGDAFTTWQVTVTGLSGYVFGANQVLDLNLSTAGTLGTVSNCSLFNGGTTCGITQDPNANNSVDGFGAFNFQLNNGPGFSNSGYLSFTFTFTTASTDANKLLVVNANGASVAGHLAYATNTACTGFAANGGATNNGGTTPDSSCAPPIPEPGTLVLFGSGLVAAAAFVRRRFLA